MPLCYKYDLYSDVLHSYIKFRKNSTIIYLAKIDLKLLIYTY